MVSPANIFLDSAGVAQNTGTATITYNSAAPPNNAGNVGVSASFNSVVIAQGSVAVQVIGAVVTPNQSASAPLGSTANSFTFQVENTGPAPATFALDLPTCTVVTNCRFSPSGTTKSVLVNPGAANKVPVGALYDAPTAGNGSLVMRASFAGVALSSATLSITVIGGPTIVAVTTPKIVAPSAASQIDSFTVTNSGPTATFTLSHNCASMSAPAAATGCTVPGPTPLVSGVPTIIPVYFTAGATKGALSTLTLTATSPGVPTSTGSGVIAVPNPVVTAPAAATVSTNLGGLVSTFTVVNLGPVSTPYFFTASCVSPVTSCPVTSGGTATLAVSNSPAHPVVVTYTTGVTMAAGSITVQARIGSATGPIISTATQSVTVQAPQVAMAVDTRTAAIDSVLFRSQCIAAAVAQAAASECGDLRIVHPLPSVRTLNAWRTPTLIYNSAHASTWITLPANLFLPVGASVPTTVSAVLKVNAVQRGATHTWAGNLWGSGTNRRVTIGFDAAASGLAQGVHPYVLEVTSTFPGGGTQLGSVSGKLVVVDRRGSPFGAGWWLAGLEQINLTTMTWVGGDGSVRQYKLKAGTVTPNRVWGAPTMTHPDTLREVAGEYVRQLPDSVWVYFNGQGQQIRTRNRLGHVTTFTYTSGRLATIVVPPAASPLTYTFNYNASNRLTSVVAPGATANRTVTITPHSTGRITSILDPGAPARTIAFGYATATDLKIVHAAASVARLAGTASGIGISIVSGA